MNLFSLLTPGGKKQAKYVWLGISPLAYYSAPFVLARSLNSDRPQTWTPFDQHKVNLLYSRGKKNRPWTRKYAKTKHTPTHTRIITHTQFSSTHKGGREKRCH